MESIIRKVHEWHFPLSVYKVGYITIEVSAGVWHFTACDIHERVFVAQD